MAYPESESNYVLLHHYASWQQQQIVDEIGRRDEAIRRPLDTPSKWRDKSLIELTTLYAFNYAKPDPDVDTQEILEELDRREQVVDAALASVGLGADACQTDKGQLAFVFDSAAESANNSVKDGIRRRYRETVVSWNEAYDAGFRAGTKFGENNAFAQAGLKIERVL